MPFQKLTALAAAGVVLFAGAARAESIWTGKIADSACGARHESGGEMGEAMSDRDCTIACVRGGSKYVLVAAGKVYRIANQDIAGLREHAGETVRVTGDLNGDTITVSKVEATPTSSFLQARRVLR